MTLRQALGIFLVLASAAPAHAQITSTGPFTGASEGFESHPYQYIEPCVLPRVFGDRADLCSPGTSTCYVSAGWSFECDLQPASGSAIFGNSNGTTELRFDDPVRRFGGWFACISNVPDGFARFYDGQDVLLAQVPYDAPAGCGWTWNGWTSESEPIVRIEIVSNWSNGGFVMLDDLQVDFGVTGLSGEPPSLSVSAGGVQTLTLVAGAANAGLPYLLLGSLTGSSPGLPLDGDVLPLNIDAYTLFTLQTPNTAPLAGSAGVLDGAGGATATFTLPAGFGANLVGLTATHAGVVLELQATLLSIPVIAGPATLDFLP